MMIVHGLCAVYVMHHMRIAIIYNTFNGNTARMKKKKNKNKVSRTFEN